MIQGRGAAQFRYGNTPLSCGGREQNVQEEWDVTWLSVNHADRQKERGGWTERERERGKVYLIKLKIHRKGQLQLTVNNINTHSFLTPHFILCCHTFHLPPPKELTRITK